MSRRPNRNVGIIGLGIIGYRVADTLRRKHLRVYVWNRTAKPVPNFVGTRREIAELCDVIQIFVADDDALRETMQELSPRLASRHVVIAHSTVAPETMRQAAEIANRRGAKFLDAPFTGSKLAAENGQLVYYVAGHEATLDQVRPILEASSKAIVAVGQVGDASTLKVATNMVTAATVQALVEALALVTYSGLPPEKLVDALEQNPTNSATLSLKLPKIISGEFEPHFSVKHMLKDVSIAERLARTLGLQLDVTDVVRRALLNESDQGRGDADYSSVARGYFPEGMPVKEEEEELLTDTELPFTAAEQGPAEEAMAAPEPPGAGGEADPDLPSEEQAITAGEGNGSVELMVETEIRQKPLPAEMANAVVIEPEPEESTSGPRNFFSRFLRRGNS